MKILKPRRPGMCGVTAPGLLGRTFLIAIAACSAVSAAGGSPIELAETVRSRRFQLHFDVQASSSPLQAVELWYTRDGGQTWTRSGVDEDRRSPIEFVATAEGLYGFYIVLYNAVGASAPRPTAGTAAQQWVLVDETPPILQARRADVTVEAGGGHVVRIEWSAYDEHFPPRPIELSYRTPDDPNWTVLAGPIANVGRFDGVLPERLIGEVSFRVLARDRVGHVASSELSPVTVEPPAAPPEVVTASFSPTVPDPAPSDDDDRLPFVSSEDARRAQKLLEYGNWFLLRGQLDVASERFQEVLQFDPANRDALINLAGVYYRRGQTGRSIESYLTLLKYHRNDIAALRGLALAYVAEKRYASAAESLEQILARIGDEPRTRIELGDVLLLSGQRSAAFQHWNAVSREPGLTADLNRDVQLRLQTFAASSR